MDLSVRMTKKQLSEFVDFINELSDGIGFRISPRGWGYVLEQRGLITKDQFDKVEGVINRCRKEGLLPVDFVAEEAARAFSNLEVPTEDTPAEHLKRFVEAGLKTHEFFTPDWWEGEKFYIQMVVEKIDLVTLFEPICARFHIPIANSKGWSSILQRAEYCRRFAEAEARGLKCVLLYCGDHDPDGLRISETLRKNLEDVAAVHWRDGTEGYDPSALKIRVPEMGRRLCEKTILEYLGDDAEERFDAKTETARQRIDEVLESTGAGKLIRRAVKVLGVG